jgi:MFS transporter, SP family, sugar:H+ symporter
VTTEPARIHYADEDAARRVLLVSAVAALGGFLFGFDTAVINGAIGAVQDEFDAGSLGIGFTVSSALLGSAVGAWFSGGLADRYGRVFTMRIAAALFFVSAIGSALAGGLWMLIAWRVVGGFAVGLASVLVPMYIAELAPAERRGRLGSLQQLAIVVGIFPPLQDIGLGFAYGLYTAAAACSILFVLLFVPETKGKELEEM